MTHSITPNQTRAALAAACGLPFIEARSTGANSLTATGANKGTTIKAISKKSKKKAKKALVQKGYDPSSAASMVKKAMSNITQRDSKPVKKAAGRGG